MIQVQLKLKLTPRQERQFLHWLRHLTAIWNWAIKKIEHDGRDGFHHRPKEFHNLLAGHGKKIGIAGHVVQGVLSTAYTSWDRCFKNLAQPPRLKGRRRRLNSILFPDPLHTPANNRVHLRGFGKVRFHKQEIPEGKIKLSRVVRRSSGWYLCLFIDTEPTAIPQINCGEIGIDPGFHDLVTLSTGEKVAHPREWHITAKRLAQAQRGTDRKLTARLQERLSNRRKDRNHKLSHQLVSENQFIAFSADRHSAIARRFGKSVASSAHHQLRQMLSYKCRTGGREYVEVDSRNSTKTCSACGCLSGPTGLAGLKVRQWTCAQCGTEHDRDVNAAINTLIVGAGLAHEMSVRTV